MTLNDFITNNRNVINAIIRNGIHPSWVTYTGLLDDYERLRKEGHQMKNIISYLCEEYCTSKTQIYRIITRLMEEIR